MSDNSVVVPPTNGTGIVTFDRGGHHGHGFHGLHNSFHSDLPAQNAERVIHDASISDKFRAQEVRDVINCTDNHGVRNLVSTKDLHVAVECANGVIRKEMTCMEMQLRERIRDDGDKTRDLIRDNENKRLAAELAEVKAQLLAMKAK